MTEIFSCPLCTYYVGYDWSIHKIVCMVFPSGIPVIILDGESNHDTPIEGDGGVVYKSREEDE